MSVLQLDDVYAGYGSGPDILQGLTLGVEEGTTSCIIGPNGAGKSTALKVICGLLRPRGGEVYFNGESLNGLRPDQILERGICFVPQDRSLFPEMTVRENLVMAGYLQRDRMELQRRIRDVLETFPDLAQSSTKSVQTLSGGQQQMVALARALIVRPRVLLVDEPSLGLAPQVARHVFDTLERFHALGMTILLVEQNAHMGLESADWGCVMDLGTKRFEGPAADILSHPDIRELYLGKAPAVEAREPESGDEARRTK